MALVEKKSAEVRLLYFWRSLTIAFACIDGVQLNTVFVVTPTFCLSLAHQRTIRNNKEVGIPPAYSSPASMKPLPMQALVHSRTDTFADPPGTVAK
jgi:hypothetical protein